MDMDVIVLKPLDSLSNTIGSEILANGEIRLNGAIMAFNKSRPVFSSCIFILVSSVKRGVARPDDVALC